jgi:hypothetical protein
MSASTPRDRLRKNLGDVGTPPAFSDAELDALLADVAGDEDTALRDGLWQLLAQGAKWNDYTTGQSDEKKSQVWDHLWAMYGEVKARVAAAADQGQAASQPKYATAPTVVVTNEFRWGGGREDR